MSNCEVQGPSYMGIIGFPSVLLAAESIGVENLDQKAAELLAEDLSYRLRNIIHNAVGILSHKRNKSKLTTSAINLSLERLNSQPVFGHDTDEPAEFIRVEEAKVFYLDEGTVDLVAMATVDTIPLPDVPSVKLNCYDVSSNVEENRQKEESVSESALLTYVEVVVGATLKGAGVFEKVLLNVGSNSRIAYVVAVIVEFIASVIEKGENSDWITNVLLLARCLISNPHTDVMTPSIAEKLKSILSMCSLKPGFVRTKFVTGLTDPGTLQSLAADAYAVLISKMQLVAPDAALREIGELLDLLKDSSHVFCSYAGALKVLGRLDLQKISQRRSCELDLLTLHASWFPTVFDSQLFKTEECVEYIGAWKHLIRQMYRHSLLVFYHLQHPERFCLDPLSSEPSEPDTDANKLAAVMEALSSLHDAAFNFFGSQIEPIPIFDLQRKATESGDLWEQQVQPIVISSGEKLLETLKRRDNAKVEMVTINEEDEESSEVPSLQHSTKRRRRVKKKASDLFDVPRRFRMLHQRDLVLVFHATEAKVRIIEHPIPPVLEEGDFHRCCAQRKPIAKLLPMQRRRNSTASARLQFQRRIHHHSGPHSIADLLL